MENFTKARIRGNCDGYFVTAIRGGGKRITIKRNLSFGEAQTLADKINGISPNEHKAILAYDLAMDDGLGAAVAAQRYQNQLAA